MRKRIPIYAGQRSGSSAATYGIFPLLLCQDTYPKGRHHGPIVLSHAEAADG